MELLVTDCLEPIHQLWRVKRDDVGSHISRSRQACRDNKGKTTLKTRLADLDKSVASYSLIWTQYLSELTQERIDLELFLKSHSKLQLEVDEVKDLLGDALDSVGSQTLKTEITRDKDTRVQWGLVSGNNFGIFLLPSLI